MYYKKKTIKLNIAHTLLNKGQYCTHSIIKSKNIYLIITMINQNHDIYSQMEINNALHHITKWTNEDNAVEKKSVKTTCWGIEKAEWNTPYKDLKNNKHGCFRHNHISELCETTILSAILIFKSWSKWLLSRTLGGSRHTRFSKQYEHRPYRKNYVCRC